MHSGLTIKFNYQYYSHLAHRQNASNLRRFADALSLISKVFGYILFSELTSFYDRKMTLLLIY